MLQFANPLFLLAGAVAAGIPFLLHLIARRPSERRALPTLRFLRADPRATIRLNRPTDRLLLLLRMLLLLLLGAGFARPSWVPEGEGTAEIVLLDRSRGMTDAWIPAVATARRLLLLDPEGRSRGALVLFDTVATLVPAERVTGEFFDSLLSAGPGAALTDYAVALRALPPVACALTGADSARATLLSSLRWEGWSPGLAGVRRAAWPGALRLVGLPPARIETPVSVDSVDVPIRRATVVADVGRGRYTRAALEAIGWNVRIQPPERATTDPSDAYVVLSPMQRPAALRLLQRADSGAAVVISADAAPSFGMTPGNAATENLSAARSGGALVFAGGPTVPGAADRIAVSADTGRLLAAWEDGRAASVATPRGEGCLVRVGTSLEGGTLPLSAAFPAAIERLLSGCAPNASAPVANDAPLPAGARQVLRGAGRPEIISLATVADTNRGMPLHRWIFVAALGVALLETGLAFRRRRVF